MNRNAMTTILFILMLIPTIAIQALVLKLDLSLFGGAITGIIVYVISAAITSWYYRKKTTS